MVESTFLIPAITLLDLTVVYWACLILGGGLLLVSSLGGGDTGADVDGGVDVDIDADAAFEADFSADADADWSGDFDSDAGAGTAPISSLAGWFSLRFMVFFVAVFGAVGVVLTHVSDMNPGLVLGIALAGGFAVGQGVQQLFLLLRRTSGNSAPQPRDYVRKLARVTIPIAHPKKGQVSLQVRDARRFVPAVAEQADASFEAGEEVVVVGYRAGIARVVSREEYEMLTHTETGGPS